MQKERGDKIGKILVDMGSIAQRDVLAALSDQLGIPLVTVDGPPPAAPEIEGLTERFLRQSRAFPMALVDSTLTLAMAVLAADQRSSTPTTSTTANPNSRRRWVNATTSRPRRGRRANRRRPLSPAGS